MADKVSLFRCALVVGNHHNGLAKLHIQTLEKRENVGRRNAVEVSRWLIGDDQHGIGDDGAGDRNPLLLAAGQLRGIVIRAIRQRYHRQREFHPLTPLPSRQPRQQQRQLHIFKCGQHRHQVVELKNEADARGAPIRQIGFSENGEVLSGDPDLPAVRLVDSGYEVQQRALAGS